MEEPRIDPIKASPSKSATSFHGNICRPNFYTVLKIRIEVKM
jgi:hypothetical protein